MSGRSGPRRLSAAAVACFFIGCAPLDDVVFETAVIELSEGPLRVREGAGSLALGLELKVPVERDVTALLEVRGVTAQDDCHDPDFEVVEGTVTWRQGSAVADVALWIGDDDLPETDEVVELTVTSLRGATLVGSSSVELVIEDDDRTVIIDANAEFGVRAGSSEDQSAPLQAALDAARELERAVVVLAPGDYEVGGIELFTGTTLSARGARLRRPPAALADNITLRVQHSGSEDSPPTLIEGVSVDGRRDAQGPYRDLELEDAHLIALAGDPAAPGRLRAVVEAVRIESGTGDGIAVGPNSEVALCRIRAHDLWREGVSLHGGGSSMRLRGLDATASSGTTGLWIDGNTPGYEETRHIDVEIEDARFATGDIEIDLAEDSRVVLRRVTMTAPPFRLLALDSSVRISDSVLQLGIPTERHNNWTLPHDVEVSDSTLIASERQDEAEQTPEADRVFPMVDVRWQLDPEEPPPEGDHRLSFERCRFELGSDLDASDTVYAVGSPAAGGVVTIRSSRLGPGLSDWFAPQCEGCELAP